MTPGQCRECGGPTRKIARRIGFFGLQETYSTHCRTCLPTAAASAGLDPAQALATHDQLTKSVAEAEEAHRRKKTSS